MIIILVFLIQKDITGIYYNNYDGSLNTQNGFPVFATVLQANFISKKEDKLSFQNITDEDIKAIVELSKDEKIATRVRNRIFKIYTFFLLDLAEVVLSKI